MMLAAIAGPDPGDPLSSHAPVDDYVSACAGDLRGLRVVWSPNLGYARVDREVRSITEGMARSFADFGCFIEERDPGWPDPAEFHSIIFDVGIANRVVDFAAAHPEWIEPTLNAMLERARSITAIDHGRALMARTTLFRKAREFFETCDLLLTPTMPVTAWSKEPGALEGPRVIDGRPTASMWDRLPFTFPFNLTGQPAAAVPCGFTAAGLPVSLQIVGRWLEESTVLRAAACFEAAHPWAGRRPELDLPSTAELPALGNEG
jgi:aspartyl-tRNA(Asn)/glutamyl-tRNA(Gln) amidotransferase subunit A